MAFSGGAMGMSRAGGRVTAGSVHFDDGGGVKGVLGILRGLVGLLEHQIPLAVALHGVEHQV